MTAEAPCNASASPSPVTLFTPLLGDAATASLPCARRLATSLDPIRPVPPITTIFITTSFRLTKGEETISLLCSLRVGRNEHHGGAISGKGKSDLRLASILTPSGCRSGRRVLGGRGRFNIALNTAGDFRIQKCGSVPRGNQNEQKRP